MEQTHLPVGMLLQKATSIRAHILEMVSEAKSGHPGGSLSAVEILVSLYFYKMRHDPKNPNWPDRDRFVLSKGHAAPVLYSTLAEAGYLPLDELKTLRKINSRLQGHPDRKVPGVEYAGGSLGIGLSAAIGMALAAKMDKRKNRVYALLGDGELDEGQVWEAAMAGAKFKLDNLTAIIDRNGIQQDGLTEQIMPKEPLAYKWKAFNWHVLEVDGFDFRQLIDALEKAENMRNRPTVIIAHTVKGKGVSFMEWDPAYHGKAPDKETVRKLLETMGR
ncbi:transketolase [Candidatus Bathyarchaeota archaeon]|nr:MAG: transketolase [Candidatus Bathyarchaeota archaeon]TMI68541.1 MAG: transketolase [Candidatus Bathyarchaeota archaeon]